MRTNSSPRLLEGEDKLAVLAAVTEQHRAVDAWAALMGRVDFIDIARSTQRLAPLIYLNLKDFPDIAERGRLRGAYKHAWSRNHKILAAFSPIVRELNARGINYRVVKGIAIQLALGIVGARVVGDVDLVVAQDDVLAVREILESHGFRCNSVSNCGLHPAGTAHQALDFNRGDVHVDLHAAELKQPSALMKEMLSEPPQAVTYAGESFLIPSGELMLLHSAVHGRAQSSETDFSQSVADIALLAPRCQDALLQRQAIRLGLAQPLWAMGQTFTGLGIASLSLSLSLPRRRPTTGFGPVEIGARKSGGLRSQVLYGWMLWRQRFGGGKPLLSALKSFRGGKLSYLLWLLSGAFSSMEKKVFARHRGFLHLPSAVAEPGQVYSPFETASSVISANEVASQCADYRFAFRCPDGVREWIMTFEGPGLDDVDVAVHLNGDRVLRMVSGSRERTLAVLNPPSANEISIRPISGFCGACVRSLASLKVTLTYRYG